MRLPFAADTLNGNPDRAGILGDLEQAMAGKCLARTGSAPKLVTLAVLSGVCLGIAPCFGVDVTLVRVIAVLLLIFSGGAMLFARRGQTRRHRYPAIDRRPRGPQIGPLPDRPGCPRSSQP